MNNLPQETEALESRLSELETLTLPEKTEEVKVVISEAYRLARRSVTEAYYAGKILVSIKTELEHGEFGPWLERNGIKHDTAARFMKLAGREISDIQKLDTISAALKSLPKPQKADNPDPKQKESSDETPQTIEELTPSEKRLMEKDNLIQQVKETAEKLQECEVSLEEEKQKNKHLLQGEKVAEGFDQGVSVIEEAQVEVRRLKRENSLLKDRASGNQERACEL